jgi:hypothetical protein
MNEVSISLFGAKKVFRFSFFVFRFFALTNDQKRVTNNRHVSRVGGRL